jgi:hypothetical protein
MYDPTVQRFKTTTMQRIQDFVRAGYFYHASGTVSAARAPALAQKFAEKYHVGISKHARARRKNKGEGNAVFMLYPIDATTDFRWWLLVTDGEHPAHKFERLLNAREKHQRVSWGDEYEIVRATKAGQKTTSWTWRMKAEAFEAWQQRIRKAVASSARDDTHLRQAIYSLYRTPGFSGIRKQVGQLVKALRGDWKRIRKAGEPLPNLPTALGYLRRLPDDVTPLSILVARQQQGTTGWFPRR